MKRLFSLSLLLSLASQSAHAAPSAILTRLSGKVTVTRGAQKIPAKNGLALQTGDRVSVQGGQVTLFSLSGPPKTLKNGAFVVGSETKKGGSASVWKGIYKGLSSGLNRQERRVAATMRPGEIRLVTPVQTRVETNRLRFEWQGITSAGRYKITVLSSAKTLWSAQTEKLSIDYPASAPALSGKLSWQVVPLRLENGAWMPDAGGSQIASFQIASPTEIQEIKTELANLAAQTQSLTSSDRALSRAALWSARGFKAAALRELENANGETATLLKEALWRDIGHDWRFEQLAPPTQNPIGGADAAILAWSPTTPLTVEKRKLYVSADRKFALQIPIGFCSAHFVTPRAANVSEFAATSQNGARLSLTWAPAKDFASPGALFAHLQTVIDQNNALAANKGNFFRVSASRPTTFRACNARLSSWKSRNKGVESQGEAIEWREGEHLWIAIFGGQGAGDARTLRPLLDTLQLDPKSVSPPANVPVEEMLKELFALANASLETMKALNTRNQGQMFQTTAAGTQISDGALQRLETMRLQTADSSNERASAALDAAQMASQLGWEATGRGDSAGAARYFARSAVLEEEGYRATLTVLEKQSRDNDALIAHWTKVTPPQSIAMTYRLTLGGFWVLKSMYLQRQHSLALDKNDIETTEKTARALLSLHREKLEMTRLASADGEEIWEEQRAVADAIDDMGDVAQMKADVDGARAYFSHALGWRRAIPESFTRRDVAASLRNRASLESAWGDSPAASNFYEQTLAEYDRTETARQTQIDASPDENLRVLARSERVQSRAVVLNNLGFLSHNLGDFTRAEAYYQRALRVVEALPTEGFPGGIRATQRAASLGNLAALRADAGDLDSAEALLQQSIEIHRTTGNDGGLALALLNAAGIADERGQTEKALAQIETARTIFAQLKMPNRLATAEIFAAKLARRSGDLARARALAGGALATARTLGDAEWIASGARSLANIELDDAKSPLSAEIKSRVLALVEEAEKADARSGAAMTQISTMGVRARWQEKSGDLEGAVSTLQAAIARLERIRATTASGEQFSDVKNNFDLYDGAVRLLLQLNRPEEAFDMLNRARSKKLRDSLQLSALQSNDPALQALLKRSAALDEKLAKTRAQLAAESALPSVQRNPTKLKNLQELVASTQAEFFEVSAQIKAKNPRSDKALSLSPRELKKAQRAIPQGTLLLQYAALDDGLYIFAVTRDELKIYAPKVSKTELQSAVRAYREAIDADLRRASRGDALSAIDDEKSPLRVASALLSQWLLAPVQSEIAASRIVAIVPSRELFYVPFHALGEAGDDKKWRFLIEDKPVAYLAAGDVLSVATTRDEADGGRGLLGFGDPIGANLPAAKIEVEAIARLFPGSTALTGADASKTAILSPSSREKRILHLAAHGVLNSARPDQSYIQLSPSSTDDGKLRVGEIYGLDLSRVDLVTLSACQTALGEGEPDGSEISSLAHSFSSAGTPSVVASLWNVEDKSTARLMESFYRGIADGKSKGTALQNAQMTLLSDEKTRHPIFWAPFELLGDWR